MTSAGKRFIQRSRTMTSAGKRFIQSRLGFIIQSRLGFTLISMLITLILTAGAVIFANRGFKHLYNHGQELAFFGISLVTSALSGLLGFSIKVGEKENQGQRNMVWGALVFGFLYVACAALCERLRVGMYDTELFRNFGLALLTAGCVVRLWAIATLGRFHSGFVTIQSEHKLLQSGPYRRLRHPSYFGIVLIAAGIPMIFGAWFPLLALPGIVVAIKWRIKDEEELLIEHFGEEYEAYAKQRWRLLPFVY